MIFLVVFKVAARVLPGIIRTKNVSVSRFLYIINNLVPDFSSWSLIFYKYISLFVLVCMQGFSGENCLSSCPYPTYGNDCQKLCNCSKDMCDVSTGCQQITTGSMHIQINSLICTCMTCYSNGITMCSYSSYKKHL